MAWWWLLVATASAVDPAAPPPEAPPVAPVPAPEPEPAPDPFTAPFGEVLRASKQAWFEGRTAEARDGFAALQTRVLKGEELVFDEVAEALTWLGEVQYLDGDPEAARLTFADLLRRSPDQEISAYHHPTEVVNLFELVRAEVKAAIVPPPAPVTSPAPAWVLLPLGVPQFAQRRTGAGFAWGGLQLALGATSVATRLHLANLNDREGPGVLPGGPREQSITRWRYGVQWPTTVGFYGAWIAGSVEAVRHHRRTSVAVPSVQIGADHVGITLAGEF